MKTWFNLHLVFSIFFLPLLVMYAVTGAMYMAGVDGQLGSETTRLDFKLSDYGAAPTDATTAELKAHGVDVPAGEWRKGKNGKFSLGSSAGRHIEVWHNSETGLTLADEVTPGLYPAAMLIHKGKAGTWFSVLGYGAAASMLILYLSGLAIVWRSRGKRPLMLTFLVLGIAAVVAGWVML